MNKLNGHRDKTELFIQTFFPGTLEFPFSFEFTSLATPRILQACFSEYSKFPQFLKCQSCPFLKLAANVV